MEDKVAVLLRFFTGIESDHRITRTHISLYTSLWKRWKDQRDGSLPLIVFSYEMYPLCKISSSSTYHRVIRQLHEYGYIRYTPSYNHYIGSRVEFLGFE